MLATVLLLGLLGVASVTDVLRQKIYNWNTYSGILAALALSVMGAIWLRFDNTVERWLGDVLGWLPLYESLGGFLLCGFLLVVCFLFFPGIGGGDVKLIAMLGTFLGIEKGLEALLWTFVLEAGLAVIVLVWRVGPVETVARVIRLLATFLRLNWFRPLSEEERKALRPPIFLAPAALVAVVIVRFSLIPA